MHRWKLGDTVVLRGVSRNIIWWACAAIVVQDTPELIAVYWQAGTPNMIPAVRSTPRDLLMNGIHLVPRHWEDTDVLMLVTPGSAHAIYVMWETGTPQLRCWYINLQEPLRRTTLGFDSMDHLLDIVISADQSAWNWKDEDEFNEAVTLGVFSTDEARAIRREGERAIHLLQTRQPPFCDDWENWRPSPEWRVPDLPRGWDHIT